jgi:GDPmannose 4,6-dehydratase
MGERVESAIVTGVTGMDGPTLSEQLLRKGYKVYGLVRRSARGELGNAAHLEVNPNFEVVEGDLLDLSSLIRLCTTARADLFVNAAAQSHVGLSFKEPVHTAQVTGLGVLNCLEAIRLSGVHTRFLQCSSSEQFGGVSPEPCNERTPFCPQSPYASAKVFGFHTVANYRVAYKMFACNSICFNHEGARRHPSFVTRKITKAAARIKLGFQKELFLGNLEAKRDWGSAEDFCRGMIMILEASRPDDYVLATGRTHTVREFCNAAFSRLDLDYKDYVKIDPRFYRPAEVDVLIGDYSKIKKDLGWEPWTSFEELVGLMVDHDLEEESHASN